MIGLPDVVVSLLAETRACLPGLRAVSQLLCELEIPHETLCGRDGAEEIVQYARSSQERGIRVIVVAAGPGDKFGRRIVASTLVPVLELDADSSDPDQALRMALTVVSILALEDAPARGSLQAFRAAHGVEEQALEAALV